MSRTVRSFLWAVALAASGCAARVASRPVVWPEPPDPPRIRFVTAFRTTEDLDRSTWAKVRRALLGASRDPGLAQPMGLAISDDGQRVYIADMGLGHVLLADLAHHRLTPFAPDEPMGKPFNVALDADENLYVSDSAGHQVLVFSRKGERLRAIARDSERPTGLAIDRARRLLYVADSAFRKSPNHRVRVFTLDGAFVRNVGTGKRGSDDGDFYFPTYLALDGTGGLYVADSMNFRVQQFDRDGRFVRKLGENGDGPGAFARLKGLAFDRDGNLYAVDGGHSNVQMFSPRFEPLMFFGGYAQKLEYFDVPSGIAIEPRQNRIYVCNEFISRINVYELLPPPVAPGVKAAR
jgi:DNA-binding beta-propeller fold protein YncE